MLSETQFYHSNRPENQGYFEDCKKCSTLMVDNWDSSTFLPILERADVPYIPNEWFSLVTRYCKDPSKVTGVTVVGRYLGKMRTQQWREYRYADSENLQKRAEAQQKEAMKSAGLTQSEMDEVYAANDYGRPENAAKLREQMVPEPALVAEDAPAQPSFSSSLASAEDLGLTPEDVDYLTLKWGSAYKPEEWVQMEQLWTEMNESYDIHTAGERDSLKMICKTSLKAHQLIDMGD